MLELLIGFAITIISLLTGYQLGRHQTLVTPDTQRKINQIFKRVVPTNEVGPVVRPNAQDNYYRDNPQQKVIDDTMGEALERLK